MEHFGLIMPEAAAMEGDMVPHAMPPPPAPDGGNQAQDQHFDMEVERFLSCLGQEIKAKHRMARMGGGGGGTGSASSGAEAARIMLGASMAGLTGGDSSLAAEAMAGMGAGVGGTGTVSGEMTRGMGGGAANRMGGAEVDPVTSRPIAACSERAWWASTAVAMLLMQWPEWEAAVEIWQEEWAAEPPPRIE